MKKVAGKTYKLLGNYFYGIIIEQVTRYVNSDFMFYMNSINQPMKRSFKKTLNFKGRYGHQCKTCIKYISIQK